MQDAFEHMDYIKGLLKNVPTISIAEEIQKAKTRRIVPFISTALDYLCILLDLLEDLPTLDVNMNNLHRADFNLIQLESTINNFWRWYSIDAKAIK